MPKLRELALEALDYIVADGEADLDTTSARQVSRIVADMNGAVQEMRDAAPQLFRGEFSAAVAGLESELPVLTVEADGLKLDGQDLVLCADEAQAGRLAQCGRRVCWVVPDVTSPDRGLKLRLLEGGALVTGWGRFAGAVIAEGDLAVDAEDAVVVPGGQWDGVFRAIFLQRWSGAPWWRNEESRKEVGRQYQAAMRMLEGIRDEAGVLTMRSGW